MCGGMSLDTEESSFSLGVKEMQQVMQQAILFTDQNDKLQDKETFLRNLQSYMINQYYKNVLYSLLTSYQDYESGLLGSTLK